MVFKATERPEFSAADCERYGMRRGGLSGCAAENINLSSSVTVCKVRETLLCQYRELVGELSGLVFILKQDSVV